MRLRQAHTLVYLFLQCLLFTLCASGQHHNYHHRQSTSTPPPPAQNHSDTEQFVCVPFGVCEPCPQDALNEPFCKPFANRRLMHCLPASSSPPSHASDHTGEIPAWQSCGRMIPKERNDFFEFILCNIGLGALALFVVFARSKRLQAMQARQLAARIGLVREVPGGWVG